MPHQASTDDFLKEWDIEWFFLSNFWNSIYLLEHCASIDHRIQSSIYFSDFGWIGYHHSENGVNPSTKVLSINLNMHLPLYLRNMIDFTGVQLTSYSHLVYNGDHHLRRSLVYFVECPWILRYALLVVHTAPFAGLNS